MEHIHTQPRTETVAFISRNIYCATEFQTIAQWLMADALDSKKTTKKKTYTTFVFVSPFVVLPLAWMARAKCDTMQCAPDGIGPDIHREIFLYPVSARIPSFICCWCALHSFYPLNLNFDFICSLFTDLDRWSVTMVNGDRRVQRTVCVRVPFVSVSCRCPPTTSFRSGQFTHSHTEYDTSHMHKRPKHWTTNKSTTK